MIRMDGHSANSRLFLYDKLSSLWPLQIAYTLVELILKHSVVCQVLKCEDVCTIPVAMRSIIHVICLEEKKIFAPSIPAIPNSLAWSSTFYGGLLDKFQYCDSNIEFFSTAPPLVIALPTLRQQKLLLLLALKGDSEE